MSPTVTTCSVLTDLSITGKVAQFGRGVLADVSDKLLAQFSNNLNTLLEQSPAAPEEVVVETVVAEIVTEPTGAPEVRRIDHPESEPVDLLETAGTPVLKRLLPVLAGVALLLIVWRLRRRRR